MHKTLSALNPIQLDALRQMILTGKVPHLMTLAKFVQIGFCEPGTFRVSPGVRRELLAKREPPARVLNPEEVLRALRSRKDAVVL